jgi:hypothetical protein
MNELDDFYTANQPIRKMRDFNQEELTQLNSYDMPIEIKTFLVEQGLVAYKNNFFVTTLPQWHIETLSTWGLKGKECFSFMKTVFGGLIYYSKGKIYRLNPFTGRVLKGNFEFIDYMNLTLTSEATLEGCYYEIYEKYKLNTPMQADEIYAVVPALPLGGSFETSSYEVVKMREHLAFLAQMYDNKINML